MDEFTIKTLFLVLFISVIYSRVRIDYYSDIYCEDSSGDDIFSDSCSESSEVKYDESIYYGNYYFSVVAEECDSVEWYSDDECDYSSITQSYTENECGHIGEYLYATEELYVICQNLGDSDSGYKLLISGIAFLGAGVLCLGFFLCCLGAHLNIRNSGGDDDCCMWTVIVYSIVVMLPVWGPPLFLFIGFVFSTLFWIAMVFVAVILVILMLAIVFLVFLPVAIVIFPQLVFVLVMILVPIVMLIACCKCCLDCCAILQKVEIPKIDIPTFPTASDLSGGGDDGGLSGGGGRRPDPDGDEFAGTELDNLDNYAKLIALRNSTFPFDIEGRHGSVLLPRNRLCPFCHGLNKRNDRKCKHTRCKHCHLHWCHICLRFPQNYDELLFGTTPRYTNPRDIPNYGTVEWTCGEPYEPCNNVTGGQSFGLYPVQTKGNRRAWTQKNRYNTWRRRNNQPIIPDSDENEEDQPATDVVNPGIPVSLVPQELEYESSSDDEFVT